MTSCLISSIMDALVDLAEREVDMVDLRDSVECMGARWLGWEEEFEEGPVEDGESVLSIVWTWVVLIE